MRSTSTKPPWAGETILVAVGACLSAIALAGVLELATAPPPRTRTAYSLTSGPVVQRVDAALAVASLAHITGLPPPVSEEPLGEGIRALDPNTYEISREAFGSRFEKWFGMRATGLGQACGSPQARITPIFRNGQSLGFKLTAIHPHSFYSQIGLVDGDVILRVNGLEMNSPEKALSAYAELKDAARFELDLERDCQWIRKTYLLQ